jgi:hypothetical protein
VVGPFRNAAAADTARHLAQDVFGADLDAAWSFVQGREAMRSQALDVVGSRVANTPDYPAKRSLERLLARIIAYDVNARLLPADPSQARYAVVRRVPDADAVEVFVVDAGILVGQARVPPADLPGLLANSTPSTDVADRDVVLRWLGAQRPPTQLVHLVDDELDALLQAVTQLLASRDA